MGLRELRQERVLTQRDLAERAGVTQKTIVDLELGRTAPHALTIRKLAKGLRMRERELARVLADRSGIGETYEVQPGHG